MRVRIVNPTAKTAFVDLRGYDKVIYPNQWGILRTDGRLMIDERRMEFSAPDKAERERVLGAFREKKLTAIPAGGAVFYFREFNASGREDVEKQERELVGAKNIFVSMDGRLLISDGSKVGQVSCSWDDGEVSTDVIMPVPTTWKRVPEKALKIEDE